MRALAHPTRLALLDHLHAVEQATATECALVVGDSPSSCSYHLRALGKWGFVEEGEKGAGRERPWRAAASRIEFAADGQASGSSGCNRWNASYTTEGKGVRFGAPAVTRKMCPVQAVMEQEQRFLQGLDGVATARIEGDRLELRNAADAIVMTLYREDSD